MAISTFSELKTAVANWLNRSDLTDRLAEFIALAESDFNRELRLRDMESTVTIPLVLGTKDYALDANLPEFLDMKSVSIASTPIRTMDSYAPDVLNDLWSGDPNGQPKGYTFFQDTLRVGPAPDSVNAVTMTLTYYKRITGLSDADPSNFILTDYPDLYLFGTLLQAAPYLKDNEMTSLWDARYRAALGRIRDAGVANE